MKWNCNNCGREIISKKRGEFCFVCQWENLIEKIEINPETIHSFMEKYHFTFFSFDKDPEGDMIIIGTKESEQEKILHPSTPRDKRPIIYYQPGIWYEEEYAERYWETENRFDEYSAFMEKLFKFGKKEKIKLIKANYKIEAKSGSKKELFKVSDIIIEKRRPQKALEKYRKSKIYKKRH